MSERLLSFYRGETSDTEGRTFEEMLGWSDDKWEACHDYIQLLFPTRRASNYNEDAPLLSETDIGIWKADPVLQENLRRAYRRWLSFLGLEEGKDCVDFKDDLSDYQLAVWQVFNHNFLRITRVLDSLKTLGLEAEAYSFYEFLKVRALHGNVSANTFRYWTDAINGNIH